MRKRKVSSGFFMIPFREILCFHDTLPKNTLYYYTNIICGEIQYLLKKTCGRTRTDERTSLRRRVAAPFGLVRVVLVAVSRRVLGCGARQRVTFRHVGIDGGVGAVQHFVPSQGMRDSFSLSAASRSVLFAISLSASLMLFSKLSIKEIFKSSLFFV